MRIRITDIDLCERRSAPFAQQVAEAIDRTAGEERK
jgi:hypothetical protein